MSRDALPVLPSAPRYRRRPPERTGPDRSAGGLFHSTGAPPGFAGIPLQSVEAATVAAVRTGYRVADAQIERLKNAGDRLRRAGVDAVGEEPERQAVDHAERLVSQSLMAGLSWLEGLAAEPGSPLQRLFAAQYRLVGRALGLVPASADDDVHVEPEPPVPSTPPVRPNPRPPAITIVHRGAVRRQVEVTACSLPPRGQWRDLDFYEQTSRRAASLRGELEVGVDRIVFQVWVEEGTAIGPLSAVVCDPDGVQVGWLHVRI